MGNQYWITSLHLDLYNGATINCRRIGTQDKDIEYALRSRNKVLPSQFSCGMWLASSVVRDSLCV
jgi:cAMP phosphodiesterase